MSAGSSVEKKYLTGSGVVREAMFQQLSWYKRFLGRSNERPPRASSSHLGSVIFEGWHAVREEERLKRLADWPFVVNTSWKVLFGCGTGLLILIEGSGIYDLLFKSGGTRGMKTIENMILVLMPWIMSLLGLRSLRQMKDLRNLADRILVVPRVCIAFLLFSTYMLLIEGFGTLVDWLS
jgi:hypothetical protein